MGYLGTRDTLSLLTPLMQSQQRNPHATLITLYINAVMEMVKQQPGKEQAPDMKFLSNYLAFDKMSLLFMKDPDTWMHNAEMLRIWDARNLPLDANKYFKRQTQPLKTLMVRLLSRC